MEVHPDITLEKVIAAVERHGTSLDDPGFCIACGAEVSEGCEPDMENGPCESCGEDKVYGADQLLLLMS